MSKMFSDYPDNIKLACIPQRIGKEILKYENTQGDTVFRSNKSDLLFFHSDGRVTLDAQDWNWRVTYPVFAFAKEKGLTVKFKDNAHRVTTHIGMFQFGRYGLDTRLTYSDGERITIMPDGWPDLSKHSGRVMTKPEPFKHKFKPAQWVWVHFIGDEYPTRFLVTNPDKPYQGAGIWAKKRGIGFIPAREPDNVAQAMAQVALQN